MPLTLTRPKPDPRTSPNPGPEEITLDLSQVCPQSKYSHEKCDFSLPVSQALESKYVLALRISDQQGQTVGKIPESTFRFQPAYDEVWTESTCWRGFYGGPLSHASCLADPRAVPHPSNELFTLQDGFDWLVAVGVAPHSIDAVSEEIESLMLRASIKQFLSLPISGKFLSEALLDASLRLELSQSSWYPLGPRRGLSQSEKDLLLDWTNPPCIGEGLSLPKNSADSEASNPGTGPIALIIVVPHGEESTMLRAARKGLSLGYEWIGGEPGPTSSAFNGSAGSEANLVAVWAEDVPLAASLLTRFVRRFSVAPFSRTSLLDNIAADAETICIFVSAKERHRGARWKCTPSQLLRRRSIRWSKQEGLPEMLLEGLQDHLQNACEVDANLDQPSNRIFSHSVTEDFEAMSVDTDVAFRYVMPKLHGLLGNVLFQVAASLSFAWELDNIRFQGHRWKVLLPSPRDPKQCGKTFLFSIFSHPSIHRRILSKVNVRDWHYSDEGACFICHYPILGPDERIGPNASIMVRGWRQSHLYFEHNKRRLLKAFSLPPHLEEVAHSKYRQLLSHALGADGDFDDVETVSVHIRRGDLLRDVGTSLNASYYTRALQRMGTHRLFLVFSDDIEWCKMSGIFDGLKMVAFVEIGVDFLELRLMSMCDHHIIANSTFSFWAAYLHRPPQWRNRCRRKKKSKKEKTIVFCPAEWQRGPSSQNLGEGQIYPPEWIRV